ELRDAVSSLLATAESLAAVTPQLLEVVALTEGWRFGALWLFDLAGRHLISGGVWSAPGVEADGLIESTRRLRLERGEGMPGRVWESGRPERVDLRRGGAGPRRELALAAGLTVALGVPLVAGGQLVGVLDFLSDVDREAD